jgi:hypothetical protein
MSGLLPANWFWLSIAWESLQQAHHAAGGWLTCICPGIDVRILDVFQITGLSDRDAIL